MASTEGETFRRRLYLFFEKYEATRLKNILALVAKADGKEEAFISALVKKYGPEPPFTPFTDEDRASLRNKLHAFYSKHDPSKIGGVDNLVGKYIGAEPELFSTLSKKYGAGADGSASPTSPASPTTPSSPKEPSSPTTSRAQPAAAKKAPATATSNNSSNGDGLDLIRERLTRFYQHYDPAKIPTINALIAKYGTDSDKLVNALVKKYGPEPPSSPNVPKVTHMKEGQPVGKATVAVAPPAAATTPSAAAPTTCTAVKPSPSPNTVKQTSASPTAAAAVDGREAAVPKGKAASGGSAAVVSEVTSPSGNASDGAVTKAESGDGSFDSSAEKKDEERDATQEVLPSSDGAVEKSGGADVDGDTAPEEEEGEEKPLQAEAHDDGVVSGAENGGPEASQSSLAGSRQEPPLPIIVVSLRLLTAAAFDYFEDASEALELVITLFHMMGESEGLTSGGAGLGGGRGGVNVEGGGGGEAGAEEPPSAIEVVEYLRKQVGDDFIAYLRGFSASSAGVSAMAAPTAPPPSSLTAAAGAHLRGVGVGVGGSSTSPTGVSSSVVSEWVIELADRLSSTFAQFEPSLLGLSFTLAQGCQGRADDLIVAVHCRYSAQFGEMKKKDMIAAQFKRRIDDFINYHCPAPSSAASLVPFLAETFKYNKEELMKELRRLYGPEPTIVDPKPLHLYSEDQRRSDASRLRTREGLLQECLGHFRLFRYLLSSNALVSGGASAALGVTPSQWSNKMYRAVVGGLLSLFRSSYKAVECLSYACGPEEILGADEQNEVVDVSPSGDEIQLVSECLTRHEIDTNPVFLIMNNDLVTPLPNTTRISRSELLGYFIELCDEAFAPKPLPKGTRDVILRYLRAKPDLIERLLSSSSQKSSSLSLTTAGSGGHRLTAGSFAGGSFAALSSGANLTEGELETAAEMIFDANLRDEEACLAYLEQAYGPPPQQEREKNSALADGGGYDDDESGGGDAFGLGYGASGRGAGGVSTSKRAQLAMLVEEEARIRSLIEFDQYTESSTAASRLRTAVESLLIARQLEEEMMRWAIPSGQIITNPFA